MKSHPAPIFRSWRPGAALICGVAFASASIAGPYTRDLDSGLVFTEEKLVWVDPVANGPHHGVKTAILVHTADLPERNHHSNSNMATVLVHDVAAGGGARPHDVPRDREQVFIVLKGSVRFLVGNQNFAAQVNDVVVAPPGSRLAFDAHAGAARILQAEWTGTGTQGGTVSRAPVLASERLRPLAPTNGKGYVTVEGNPRQNGNKLSILAVGAGHIESSNSLLLYPADITAGRPFTANTTFARMGMSAYSPGGGTLWHFHPEREQAFVVVAGRALLEIGGNTVDAKAGDIYFAPRHVGHAYKTMGDEPFKFFELEWGR